MCALEAVGSSLREGAENPKAVSLEGVYCFEFEHTPQLSETSVTTDLRRWKDVLPTSLYRALFETPRGLVEWRG